MSLSLSTAPVLRMSDVTYTITAPQFTRTGNLDSDDNVAMTTTFAELPASVDYEIVVSATPTDGGNNACAGSASFAVSAGATTLVSMTLDCSPPRRGRVDGGNADTCPLADGSLIMTCTPPIGTGGASGIGGASGAGGARDAGPDLFPWPGTNAVVTVDQPQQFSGNLSGLSYDPATSTGPAVMWAVQNSPSTLYRLLWNGTSWASTTTNSWAAGKSLHYPGGTGTPDSEGVTKAEAASSVVYVSVERNGDVGTVSRLSVLRFDTDALGPTLTATHEWNLTRDLPVAGANLGLEAITWIPDAFLVGAGFVDDSTNQPYAPARYANHGTGLFFVGLEANGMIYGYALDHTAGAFHRVAAFAGGQASIMDLSFDRDVGYLWAYCDNGCANRAAVLQIDSNVAAPTHGHFGVRRMFDHPSTLPDANNEGIGIAPESECVNGKKPFFWSDDGATGGYSLRRDTIPCGRFF